MTNFETFRQAKAFLEEQGRVSLGILKRQFGIDDTAAEQLVEELVSVQRVAARSGDVLEWVGQRSPPTTPENPAASGVGIEAERRQLTVMFCDLVGSSALSARIDAEDYREVVRAYQACASQAIDRYRGYIAQFLGDGILVYFGFPQAHEDDAACAVRAGREIIAAIGRRNDDLDAAYGTRLAVRIGIHTGPVVVGEMGSGARRETLALGATMNIAARIQGVAKPDAVVISGTTLRLVRGMFITQDLGTPQLAGIDEPISVHAVLQATSARSRLDLDPNHLTPLIGRNLELSLLAELWAEAQAQHGQVALISGEAGVGKSRLVRVLRDQLATAPHRWIECYSSAYTQGSAFFPIIELIESELDLRSASDAATKLVRLERALDAAGLSLADTVPFLAPLLQLTLPEQRYPRRQESQALQRRSTMEALLAWFRGSAARVPLVLLVEDLHWCDASTLEFLGVLIRQAHDMRLMTVLTFRPEFAVPWQAFPHVTRLTIERLLPGEAADLIARISQLPLPAAVVSKIVERADGVALFLEELTQMVLESDLIRRHDGRYELAGAQNALLAIPATLQDSLMARLDRLRRGKNVAQQGAVVGRSFSYELLTAVISTSESELRGGLAELVEAGLLFEHGTLPQATYTFKHAMIQDVAYESLLRNARRTLHGRLAEVLTSRFADRAGAGAERIARHFDCAARFPEAIAQYQLAGKRAAERSAHEEAIGHFKRAIALRAPLSASAVAHATHTLATELELQIALGPSLMAVRGYSSPEVRDAYERAAELSEAADVSSPRIAPVLSGLWTHAIVSGAFPKALGLGARLLQVAEHSQNEDLLLEAHVLNGVTRSYTGPLTESLRHLQIASAMYEPAKHAWHAQVYGQDPLMASRSYAGLALWWLGAADQAAQAVDEAIDYARQINHPRSLAFALANAARCHLKRGDYARCVEVGNAAAETSIRHGYPDFKAMGELHAACADYRLGGGSSALERLQCSLAELSHVGNSLSMPFYRSVFADALSVEGRFDEAWASLKLADAALARHVSDCDEAEVYRVKGLVASRQHAAGEIAVEPAGSWLEKAVDTAKHQGALSWELQAATTLAQYQLANDSGPAARADAIARLEGVMMCIQEGQTLSLWQDATRILERALTAI